MSTTLQRRLGQLRGLAVVSVVATLVVSCADSPPSAPPSATPTRATPTSAPPSTSPGVASPTNPASATTRSKAGARSVAVYYLRDTTNGPRLYREFHRRPATTGVVRDAVTAMLTEPADDRDYTSLWPRATRVRGVRLDGSTAIVDLSKEAGSGSSGASFEHSSLQQLVWTATAADPSVKAVQLLIEGRKVQTLWGHVDASKPMSRGRPATELGPVWILTPIDGGTIPRGGRFGGEASVDEATVSWEIVRDGKAVKAGFDTATDGPPARGSWSAVVDVPPGDYVLRAFQSSNDDGSEMFVDDKRITVV